MTEFAALKPKTYSYLRDDNEKNKKAKKRKLNFVNYKHCLTDNINQLKIK